MATRRAVITDLPRLVELASAEHGRSRFASIPFEPMRAQQTLERFITGFDTAVFISERGFIMGMVQALAFSRLWNAYEVAWYSEDASGMDLLKAFIKWADGMKALEVVVHNYAGVVDAERFSKVLGRKGFSPLGSSYIKKLGVN